MWTDYYLLLLTQNEIVVIFRGRDQQIVTESHTVALKELAMST